jgi:hypothetical protein
VNAYMNSNLEFAAGVKSFSEALCQLVWSSFRSDVVPLDHRGRSVPPYARVELPPNGPYNQTAGN